MVVNAKKRQEIEQATKLMHYEVCEHNDQVHIGSPILVRVYVQTTTSQEVF